MGAPSPFEVSRAIGTNLNNSFNRVKDENAIERILSEANQSGDPAVLQGAISKILSQVAPERQGAAVQHLQSLTQNIQEKQKLQREEKEKLRQREAATKYGVDADLPPALQAEIYKQKAKGDRLNSIYGTGGQPANPVGQPMAQPQQQITGQEPSVNQNVPQQSFLRGLSDDQLVLYSGHPDKEISEPAKQELKRRQEERTIDQKKEDSKIKRHTDLSQKVLEKADQIAEALPQKKSALGLMKDAIVNRDLSFWSRDNLAELTGIEGLRSQEGAIFKTAAKEYFLGNIARAGARPNQWIEQQISDMMTKIGRSPEANLSVSRALENELGLDEERVRLTEQISNELENSLGYIPRDLGTRVNRELSKYAERKQLELYNDLRAIKSIAEKEPQKMMKVEEGTPVSKVVAQALLRQFNNDPKKAAEEAKKLGYVF